MQNPLLSLLGLTAEYEALISEEVKRTMSESNLRLQEFIKNQIDKAEGNVRALSKQ